MNIVLLSGGSGKRLWPLSNEIRSKQFLKLFKDEKGEYESMLQRVYRQITAVDNDAKITIATSRTQVSAIRNQIGDKAALCIEPCRRDTFPAIVLAAAYLHDVAWVDENECVAVCPVDAYVDEEFYRDMLNIEKLVLSDKANLSLIGIEPALPSKKYGYIIPSSGTPVSMVKEFKEKPDKKAAEKYVAAGGIWNAGVFGFRLKYVLDKAQELLGFSDYKTILDSYSALKPISFDYAVVEHEKSAQVIRYSGNWKDVGTWNMLYEVMPDRTKGNVTLDETCENVLAINELDIPILCMGCKDMVVAASCDGILVTDRERSAAMKSYVENIDESAKFAEKSWGTYRVLAVQPGSMTVKVELNSGNHMRYHMHELRKEIWTVVSGKGKVIIDGVVRKIKTGDVITIPAGTKHAMYAETDLDAIEIQIGNEITDKDKIVFDDETVF